MPLRTVVVMLPVLLVTLTGCSSPPTAEVDAARQSMASASSANADKYAAESLTQAQAAEAALDAELKAQEGKFIKSYDHARELAVAAKTAADKAATDATSERERADAEAARRAKAAPPARARLSQPPLAVGGRVGQRVRIKAVPPAYRSIAGSAGVQGDVVIGATSHGTRKVADARAVNWVPMLVQ